MMDEAKAAAEVLGAVVKAAADTEGGRLAREEMGKTALTVARLVNNALLPIAAVNFAFDKAKQYFTEKFADEMQARVKDIPADELAAPKASIAGQALQGLAYSHDEEELKSLYLGLLAKAMDKREVSSTHPAFVEIIRQLSAKEVDLLTKVLSFPSDLPIVEFRLKVEKGYRTLDRHILNLRTVGSNEPVVTPSVEVFVENWRRLGLIEIDYNRHLLPLQDVYKTFDSRPEYISAKSKHPTGRVDIQPGILHRTQFGRDFARAVGMLDATKPFPRAKSAESVELEK
jgi:hypothetical protein